jgi:hypothetical protein
VNKKKQKNFFTPGRAGFNATGPVSKKFFAPLFFKKAASFLFQLNLSGAPASGAETLARWRLFRFAVLAPNRRAHREQEPHHESHRRSRLHA